MEDASSNAFYVPDRMLPQTEELVGDRNVAGTSLGTESMGVECEKLEHHTETITTGLGQGLPVRRLRIMALS